MVRARSRIPLRTRFLELAPGDPRALEQLRELSGDYQILGQPHKALAALDRFGAKLNAESGQIDALRITPLANVRRWRELLEVSERLLQCNKHHRSCAWAMMACAWALETQQQHSEARRVCERLIATFGASLEKGLQDRVSDARVTLQRLR